MNRKRLLTDKQEVRFKRVWDVYPWKVAKTEAKREWKRLDPDDADTDMIVANIKARVALGWQYVPHLRRYLHNEWFDEDPGDQEQPNRQDEPQQDVLDFGEWREELR